MLTNNELVGAGEAMPGKICRFCALLLALALAVKPGTTASVEGRPNFLYTESQAVRIEE